MLGLVRGRIVVGAALALTLAATIVLASAGAAPAHSNTCFGGPPIGSACGTLTEANLHQLVADLTLAQKVGFVHGQPESNDPQFGCGNTGQPNAFPVINPGATGEALVAGCVARRGSTTGSRASASRRCDRRTGPRASA